jgi:hypothetical protein
MPGSGGSGTGYVSQNEVVAVYPHRWAAIPAGARWPPLYRDSFERVSASPISLAESPGPLARWSCEVLGARRQR